ncbi:MAG: response regulator [Lachnospiraceae bacterium]|nr:response regulator [Lachnospiraceae bacterium]
MGLVILCVDNDKTYLEQATATCKKMEEISDVICFTKGTEAIEWFMYNKADIVILDMNISDLIWQDVVRNLKDLCPEIVFVLSSAQKDHAYEAYEIHAGGFLLKPFTNEKLTEELRYAEKSLESTEKKRVRIQTFGEFDVYVNGKPISFTRSKAKELLAFLVDRQGANMARTFIFSALWEDRDYDRSMQKQLDVIIRSLRQSLSEYGISDIIELSKGQMRVCPEKFTCDVYQLFSGEKSATNSYRGEYMSAYSWASATEGYIDRVLGEM